MQKVLVCLRSRSARTRIGSTWRTTGTSHLDLSESDLRKCEMRLLNMECEELAQSVCTFVSESQIVNTKDVNFQPKDGDVKGPEGLILRAAYTKYRDHTWAPVANRVSKKRDELLMNLSDPPLPKAANASPEDIAAVDALPWPKESMAVFCNKFADQPVYGRASGFMVSAGIIATAAHAIHEAKSPIDFKQLKVVFNLRRQRIKAGVDAWEYVFDQAFDIERYIQSMGLILVTRLSDYQWTDSFCTVVTRSGIQRSASKLHQSRNTSLP